jgi:hypothetical protein
MTARNGDPRLPADITPLSAEEITSLIDEARTEARMRVYAMLVEAMTDAMLGQVRATLDPPAPAPAAPPAVHEGTGLYVYCVLHADSELPVNLSGIDGGGVPRLIHEGDLAAAVSDVSLADFGEEQLRAHLNDMDWLERTARAHEAVLEAIGGQLTLIPMRLCTVYRATTGLSEMLDREGPTMAAALDFLAGKAEWGVKVFADDRPAPQRSPGEDDDGAGYMRRRQHERNRRLTGDQERYEAAVLIHERLVALVTDAQTSPAQRPEASGHTGTMLLNGVYLVDHARRQEFLETVEQIAAEHTAAGLELQVTGPWPPYNFVPDAIGVA